MIARTVADARLVFELLTSEAASPPPPGRARILVVTETPIGMAPGPAAAVARAASALAAAGHSIESLEWDPLPVAESYKVVRRVSIGAWPGEPEEYGPIRTLLAEGRTIPATDYWRALRNGLAAGRRIRDRLEAGFDAILTPTIGLLPMPHDEVPAFLGEAWNQHVQFVLPISYSWLPSISIPAGEDDGLPVGVMLTGHLRREEALLQLAGRAGGDARLRLPPPARLGLERDPLQLARANRFASRLKPEGLLSSLSVVSITRSMRASPSMSTTPLAAAASAASGRSCRRRSGRRRPRCSWRRRCPSRSPRRRGCPSHRAAGS